MKDGLPLSLASFLPTEFSATARGSISSDPGLAVSDHHCSRGVRRNDQAIPRSGLAKSSRNANEPVVGTDGIGDDGSCGRFATRGTASPCFRMVGQSSVHVTGSKNVSRPVL